MSKSPLAIARTALEIGPAALVAYSSKYSPRTYTQPQLFACLVLKVFLKTDYRGLVATLQDFQELQATLGLTNVPHYSTLCYAHQRLLKDGLFHTVAAAVMRQAQDQALVPDRPTAVIDATGLEARQVSRYYVWRKGYRRFSRSHWPKVTLVGDTYSHLIATGFVTQGPSQDSPQFKPALRQAAALVGWDRLLADAAYDAEQNHQFCREQLGIRSTVIPLNRRRGCRWPKGRDRLQMKRCFHRHVFRFLLG